MPTADRSIRVRFNDLPRATRERVYAALTATPVDSRVLAFEVRTVVRKFKYLTLIAAGIGAVVIARNMYARAVDARVGNDIATYALLALCVAVFLASAVGVVIGLVAPPPPFREGRYAFGGNVLELRDGWLRILPSHDLGPPTVVKVLRNHQYSYSRLELGGGAMFSYGSEEKVNAAVERVLSARARFVQALAARDLAALEAVDPLAECSLTGRWSEPVAGGPRIGARPRSAAVVQWLLPLLIGAGAAAFAQMRVDGYLAEHPWSPGWNSRPPSR